MKKHLLRLSLLLFIYQASITNAKAQWVSIPDTNFGTWLNTNGYSNCMQGDNAVGWEMDTTCYEVQTATTMNCYSEPIRNLSGIEYFDHLTWLDCSSDSIIFIPALPPLLRSFSCNDNQLTSLPDLPDSLVSLSCRYNQLISLPTLPSSLGGLECGNNQLTYLPSLPVSLHWLYCYYNLFILLPALPDSLTFLACDHNQLTTLPSLPASLTVLWCDNNQLTTLSVLPNSLTLLSCTVNQLTSLPTLPNSLNDLRCNDNQLTSLPALPDSLNYFGCNNNSNLTCLPHLKKIVGFYFSNTSITCFPNYPQSNIYSIPPLNSLPLCDALNPNGCSAFWNIEGLVYVDSNINCNHDPGENGFTGVKVQLYQGGILLQQNYTGNGSAFSFDTNLGDYSFSIDTTNLPLYAACPDTGYYTSNITALDSFDYAKDFGLRCKPGFDVGIKSINGWGFRPASLRQVDIHAGDMSNFYGANCAAGVSGTVTVTITGSAHYISPAGAALTPSVSGNVLTYTVADFGTVNFNSSFNINIQTDTTAVIGSQICFTVSVTPTAGDNNPSNNTLTYCFTVVGSFDPNEKEVYPAGDIDTATKWLTYTIHFQNTGTAEAQHIYVTDTLDTHVDPASFQLLAYSHQPMVQIKENAVRFNFPNINLPDSNTNEAASHGYVQYKVKLKDNLPVGTNISNTAFIYFDFNSAVVTNTTSNTIALATGIKEFRIQKLEFRMNPNPASSSVNVSVSEEMVGGNLTVYDVTGRKMSAVQLQTTNFKLETTRFARGVYFVTVENERGRVTRKLVIE